MRKIEVEEFLNTPIEELKVVEITDGEITLEYPYWPNSKFITLYLNHELNEDQGLPKEFSKRKER